MRRDERASKISRPRAVRAMARSETASRLWPYISRSIERIVAALADLEAAGVPLHWRPPAAGANSVYVLAVHALGSTEQRLLAVLCGLDVERDREAAFAASAGSAQEIAGEWRALSARIAPALSSLSDKRPREAEAPSGTRRDQRARGADRGRAAHGGARCAGGAHARPGAGGGPRLAPRETQNGPEQLLRPFHWLVAGEGFEPPTFGL